MTISMSQSARYVTQSSVYDSPLLGPLTDRKIQHYMKKGFYGEQAKRRALERDRQKKEKSARFLKEFFV